MSRRLPWSIGHSGPAGAEPESCNSRRTRPDATLALRHLAVSDLGSRIERTGNRLLEGVV